jgi:hypothetical protein
MDSLDDGWRIERTVFSGGECDALLCALQKSNAAGRAGTRHLMSNLAVNEIAHDARPLRIARRALGSPAFPTRTRRPGRFHEWLPFVSTWMPQQAKMAHCEWCRDRIVPAC